MSTLAEDALAAAPVREREIPGPSLTDLLLVTMSLIWGINYTVVKYGTSVIAPLAYNGVRVTMAAVTLLAVVWWTKRPLPSRRDTITLLALGVLGNGIYQLLFIEGVARTRAGDAALVLAASPAFIAIFGRVLGVERITARGVVGILLSLAGMAFVVVRPAMRIRRRRSDAHRQRARALRLGGVVALQRAAQAARRPSRHPARSPRSRWPAAQW